MSEYQVSNIDPSVLATVNQELNKREEQQRRQYLFLQELQSLARELPRYSANCWLSLYYLVIAKYKITSSGMIIGQLLTGYKLTALLLYALHLSVFYGVIACIESIN